MKPIRIAVDTGGTFTDCVYRSEGQLRVLKVPSTPADPGRALLEAVTHIADGGPAEVRHGTTVGTNALLERKGAKVAFVTTAGFEDTIAIGRQARPKLYDLLWQQEPPLVGEDLRFGVAERVASDGTVLEAVSTAQLAQLKAAIEAARPESVALSLLFAFANPANERKVADALRDLGIPISVSHEILPEFREYERAATLVVNAYLAPVMQTYLGAITRELEARGRSFHIMQSSGGIMSASTASREPVRTILSGPAGGLLGAAAVARTAGFTRILTFDMGGTSTDVAFAEESLGLRTTKEAQLLGMPIAIPMLDIHTVGAGGGSLASFDRGGVLKVGPQSAGADPGPICYGRGELPTVTDANLLLGRFDPGWRLADTLQLDEERTREHFSRLKGSLHTVEEFAEGIIRVIDARMAKALRHISVERGQDPRDCILVSFGGAGPLHAVSLARALDIPQVLIPNFPGALSAYGILVSDFVRDYSRTVMLTVSDDATAQHFHELEVLAESEMRAEGLSGTSIRSLDMRYAGQGFELQVPWSASVAADFHRIHQQQYGYSDPHRPIEIVNTRVRCVSSTEPIELRTIPNQSTDSADLGAHKPPDAAPCKTGTSADLAASGESAVRGSSIERRVFVDGAWHHARCYARQNLRAETRLEGPAVLVEYSATTFLPPRSAARVDSHGNLIVDVNA